MLGSSSEDQEWLEARERGESVEHVAPELRARYANLERFIAELPPDGWQARVLAGVDADAARRRRRLAWITGGACAAAAAVVIVLLGFRRPSAVGDQLVVEIEPNASTSHQYMSGPGSNGEALVHDTLRVRGTPGIRELRVYPVTGGVIARCPGGPHCTAAGGIELVLDVPGPLDILGFAGCTPPAPGADRAADETAARAAHCEIVSRPAIKVR